MVSQRFRIALLLCICDAWWGIVRVPGSNGFLGQNIASTLHIRHLLRPLPFQVVYGRDPPSLIHYKPGSARVAAVDRQLKDRDEFLTEIRERL